MSIEVTINVTAKDIENGRRCDTGKCPIALAAARVLSKVPGANLVNVGTWSIWFRNDDEDISWWGNLPDEAHAAIMAFDALCPVMPFKFKVTLEDRRTRED